VGALELLSPTTVRLIEERGFKELTPPQKEAIPLVLQGHNVLIVAPTGTGKTEAAIIPIVDLMQRGSPERGVKLIYITPLRALNRDILDRIKWWFLKLDLKVSVRHGDTPFSERRLQSLSPPDVLVTTPETFQLLFIGRILRELIKSVKWVIVDEVHEIFASKRGAQLAILLEKLRRLISPRRLQIIGLSATVGNPRDVASFIAGSDLNCKVVYVPVAKRIEVRVLYPKPGAKDFAIAEKIGDFPEVVARLRIIRELVDKHKAVIIFTNTRPTAELLASRLKMLDIKAPIEIHHGSLSAETRKRAESGLKMGEIKGLVATSSMELGIDVGRIDLVIQYNSPREVSKLVQRVGRSGHKLGETSRGVVITQGSNDALEALVLKAFLKKEKIEPIQFPLEPLDVLAHEIIGFFISERERGLNLEVLYEFFKLAYPYRDLSWKEFIALIDFLEQLKVVKRIGDKVVLMDKRYAYKYFYRNLSMIPEIKQYLVVNVKDGLPVGILDDFFVAYYCEPGVKFIMAGRPWRVVRVSEDLVQVEPEEDYLGAIPSWIGEEIPVPYEVAQEVGRIRDFVASKAREGLSLKWIASILAKKYDWENDDVEEAVRDVYYMARRGLKVPSDREIVIEGFEDIIVVHAHFGTRVNRTLARYLSYKLSEKYGISVAISEKPYTITIKSKWLNVEDVALCLKNVNPEEFASDVRRGVIGSRLFKWRLAQVARKMGVLDPDVKLSFELMDKLSNALRGTPVYDEALKDVLTRDLDLQRASEVIQRIASGEIGIHVQKAFSPLSEQVLHFIKFSGEVVKPERRGVLSLLLFKAKLLSRKVAVGCLTCGHLEEKYLYEIGDSYRCPVCGGSEIAFSNRPVDIFRKTLERYIESPNKFSHAKPKVVSALYEKYGLRAIMGLVLGLSLKELREVLGKDHESLDEFIKELYILSKRRLLKHFGFWKGGSLTF